MDIDLDIFKYKSPKTFPNLFFFRHYYVGSSGSGKTFSATEFLKMISQKLDKVYIINPTMDRKLRTIADEVSLYKEYPQSDDKTIETIIDEIKEDIKTFKKYYFYKSVFKKYSSLKEIPEDILISSYLDTKGFDKKEIRILDEYDFKPPGVAFEDFDYKIKPPNTLILIDDSVGSNIFREGRSPLINFFIKARHYKTNIIILSQYFKAVPKKIRSNMTGYILFKTFDKTQLNSVYEEINSFLSYEDFLKLVEDNTKEKHSFIFIDLKNQVIKKGFEKVLYNFA
jgi:hypothetical protein